MLPGTTIGSVDQGEVSPYRWDIDGDHRTYGSTTDIGADEFTPLPVAETPVVDHITSESVTVRARVLPYGRQTNTTLHYGTSPDLGVLALERFVSPGEVRPMVSLSEFPLRNLTAGVTYYGRVIVRYGRDGTIAGELFTFTTATLPPPGPKPLFIFTMRLLERQVFVGQPATLFFRLKEPAKLTVTIDRHREGRMRGSRCRISATTGKRLTKTSRVGSVRRTLDPAAGDSSFRIPARINGRLLEPGWYRLTMTGNASSDGRAMKPQSVSLIVKRSPAKKR